MIKPKTLPRDPNSRAFRIMQYATGQVQPTPEEQTIPSETFTKSGSEGGTVRAKSLTKKRRSEIAANASRVRWGKSS